MKKIVILPIVLVALLVASVVYVRTAEAVSFRTFIEVLIEKGIIAEEKAESVRKFADVLDNEQGVVKGAPPTPMEGAVRNADIVKIEVSQLLQYGTRTYTEGDDVRGIIMIVENTSDQTIEVDGRRKCIVSYQLHNREGALVYDSAAHDPCTSGESIYYMLEPKQKRIIEVVHEDNVFHLEPGTYTMKLDYPGYGSGEKEIVIDDKE